MELLFQNAMKENPQTQANDETAVIVSFDPNKLDPQVKGDLEANAHLNRCSPEELLARILHRRLGGLFKVRPVAISAHG